MHHGILDNANRERQSFCFRRSIPGIDHTKVLSNTDSHKNWIDLKGKELDLEARVLLTKLKEDKVPSSGLPASRTFDFEVLIPSRFNCIRLLIISCRLIS